MKHKSLLIAVAGFLLFAGCLRQPKVINIPLSPELKTAFNFQVGTYWIYKDSLTGLVDSFYVISNRMNNTKDAGNYSHDQITIDIEEVTVFPASAEPAKQKWRYTYVEDNIDVDLFDTSIYTGSIMYYPLVNYPYQIPIKVSRIYGGSAYYAEEQDSVRNIYQSLSLGGRTYNNVALTSHKLDINNNGWNQNPYHFNDLFYVSPDIGILKMSLNHTSSSTYTRVWELQRSHIVK